MRSLWSILACAALCVACGDDAPGDPDARDIDAAVDSTGCLFFTAELLDWDSTPTDFLGVFDARFTVPGIPSLMASTAPNGRVEMCVPPADPLQFYIDAPEPYVDGHAIVDGMTVVGPGRAISLRTFTAARAETFYAEHGLTYDATKAHVLVFESFDRVDLTLDRAHDAVLAASEDGEPGVLTWAAGTSGRYVLFPNVDVAQATALLTGAQVDLVLPVAAGQLTIAVTFTVFV